MTTIEATKTTVWRASDQTPVDEAQLAATAFLARYSSRTLDAYRHDLRYFFQWASDTGLEVLAATRPHVETYRCVMEERASQRRTIDRRLSTVCGVYRFAHIDGRTASIPAQYVRRQVHPSTARGMDRSELGVLLFTAERYDRPHAALAVLLGLNGLRVSEACGANIEDLGFERRHRILQILGKGNKPAMIPLVPRTVRTINSPSETAARDRSCSVGTDNDSTAAPHIAGCAPSATGPRSAPSTLTCSEPLSS